jgi:hypothetical protein
MNQIKDSTLFECRECRSRLVEDGKCLTCDSVQIQIQKELSECEHSVKRVLSFEDDTLECLVCGEIFFIERKIEI